MDKKLNNLLGWEDFKTNWKPQVAKPTKRTETGLDVVKEGKVNEISRGLVARTSDALRKKGHIQRSITMRDYVSPGELDSPKFRFIEKSQYIFAKFWDIDIWMFVDTWLSNEGEGPSPLSFTFRDEFGNELNPFWIAITSDGNYELDSSYNDDENYPDGRLVLFSDRKEAVNFARFLKSPGFVDYLNKKFEEVSKAEPQRYGDLEPLSELKDLTIKALSKLRVNDFYRD